MEILNAVNKIIVIFGVPTILGVCIYIGRKLQVIDDLVKTVDTIKHNLKICTMGLVKNGVIDGDKLK